jgi:hypothetical protein
MENVETLLQAAVEDDDFDAAFDADDLLTAPVYEGSKDDFSFNNSASASEGDFGVFECEPKSNPSDSFSNSDSFASSSPHRAIGASPRRPLPHHMSRNVQQVNLHSTGSPTKNRFEGYGSSSPAKGENVGQNGGYAHSDGSDESPLPYQESSSAPYALEEPLRPPSRMISHENNRNTDGKDEGDESRNARYSRNNEDQQPDEPLKAVFEDDLLEGPLNKHYRDSFQGQKSQEHGSARTSPMHPIHMSSRQECLYTNDLANSLPMRMSSVDISSSQHTHNNGVRYDDAMSPQPHAERGYRSPARSYSTNSYFRPGNDQLNGPMMVPQGVVGDEMRPHGQTQLHLSNNQDQLHPSMPLHHEQSMSHQQNMPQHAMSQHMPQDQQNHMQHSPMQQLPNMSHMPQQQLDMSPQHLHQQQMQQQQHQLQEQQRFQQMQSLRGSMQGGGMHSHHHMQSNGMQGQMQQGHGGPMNVPSMQPHFHQQQHPNMQQFHGNNHGNSPQGMLNNSSPELHHHQQHFHQQHQQNHMTMNGSSNGGFSQGHSSAFAGIQQNVSIASSTSDVMQSPKTHLNGYDPHMSPSMSRKNLVAPTTPNMGNVMEKLSETMRRSAMSRSMVKQFSGRNLVHHNSMRNLLVKQGSARSQLGHHASNRTLVSQGSNRNLMSQGSDRNIAGEGMVARTPPTRRMSHSSSVNAKHHLQHQGRGLMRNDSQQSLNGRSNHGISVQIDGRNVGMI